MAQLGQFAACPQCTCHHSHTKQPRAPYTEQLRALAVSSDGATIQSQSVASTASAMQCTHSSLKTGTAQACTPAT